MEADPFYQLAFELNAAYSQKVAPAVTDLTLHLSDLQRQYMIGLIEAFPAKRFYPTPTAPCGWLSARLEATARGMG